MSDFHIPPEATPHSVEVTDGGVTAIMRGYVTADGTFVIFDIDTKGMSDADVMESHRSMQEHAKEWRDKVQEPEVEP